MADELDRLRARVEELEAALRPFAEHGRLIHRAYPDLATVRCHTRRDPCVGDYRRAAALLPEEPA